MMTTTTRIILGMSGGVDSSVSAYLLQQQGYTVEGLFMKNWEEDDTDDHCSAAADKADAQAVCQKLGIKLHTVNFAQEYWDNVFEHFLQEYAQGRTPNPDILCNKEIKFKAFLDYALALGADQIATGHYARINKKINSCQLLKGLDPNKDQSYFLYAIDKSVLNKSLFPVGEITKSMVRDIAQKIGLINHNKKDSTGICFIGERRFKTFLQTYLPAKPGKIYDDQQNYIGEHQGVMYYTLGQRSGINIGGVKHAKQAPWYVIGKDIENNILYVGQEHDHPWLLNNELIFTQSNWFSEIPAILSLDNLTAKIRYRSNDAACKILQIDNDTFQLTFSEKQRAITPGQSVVLYHNDICLGGGVIN